MEIKSILTKSYTEVETKIQRMLYANFNRRRKLERTIYDWDEEKCCEGNIRLSLIMENEEECIDALIEQLQELKTDIRFSRVSLLDQITDRKKIVAITNEDRR